MGFLRCDRCVRLLRRGAGDIVREARKGAEKKGQDEEYFHGVLPGEV